MKPNLINELEEHYKKNPPKTRIEKLQLQLLRQTQQLHSEKKQKSSFNDARKAYYRALKKANFINDELRFKATKYLPNNKNLNHRIVIAKSIRQTPSYVQKSKKFRDAHIDNKYLRVPKDLNRKTTRITKTFLKEVSKTNGVPMWYVRKILGENRKYFTPKDYDRIRTYRVYKVRKMTEADIKRLRMYPTKAGKKPRERLSMQERDKIYREATKELVRSIEKSKMNFTQFVKKNLEDEFLKNAYDPAYKLKKLEQYRDWVKNNLNNPEDKLLKRNILYKTTQIRNELISRLPSYYSKTQDKIMEILDTLKW